MQLSVLLQLLREVAFGECIKVLGRFLRRCLLMEYISLNNFIFVPCTYNIFSMFTLLEDVDMLKKNLNMA